MYHTRKCPLYCNAHSFRHTLHRRTDGIVITISRSAGIDMLTRYNRLALINVILPNNNLESFNQNTSISGSGVNASVTLGGDLPLPLPFSPPLPPHISP